MAYIRLNPSSYLQVTDSGAGQHSVVSKAVFLLSIFWFWAIFTDTVMAESDHAHTVPGQVMHLGAASCASSLCHGSVQPFEQSVIAQNEYIIWQSDRFRNMHAKAFIKLQSREASAIAEKLGLGAADEAAQCLSCHADLVPASAQGERFQLSDGVSCETCHGAAGEYIDVHTHTDKSLEDMIGYGLYPTWKPRERAKLCLSCHLGGDGRIINHRMMGAGHPRLSFELDTFTYLQPHHIVDQDYIDRKGKVDFVRDWALGQGLAAIQSLNWLLDRDTGWHGIFVEPTLLDCHSCHQRMDAGRWQKRTGTGLGPGEMRLNDANLVMFRMILVPSQPQLARQLRMGNQALHRATTVGFEAVFKAAAELKLQIEAAIDTLESREFTVTDLEQILEEMKREVVAGELKDYLTGEQAAMAIVNLVLAFERGGILERNLVRQDLDRLFEVVADEYAYHDHELLAVIQALLNHISGHISEHNPG